MSNSNLNFKNIENLEKNENIKKYREKIYQEKLSQMPNMSKEELANLNLLSLPKPPSNSLNQGKRMIDLLVIINNSIGDLDIYLDIILSSKHYEKKNISKNIILLLSELDSLKNILKRIIENGNKKIFFNNNKYILKKLLIDLSLFLKTVSKNKLQNVKDINNKIVEIINLIMSWYEINWKI